MTKTCTVPFETKKLYPVEVPEEKDIEQLKESIFDILIHWIKDDIGKPVKFSNEPAGTYDGFWDIVKTDWVIEKGDMQGTMPKRISKFFAKFSDVKIPETTATKIGNVAGKFFATKGKLYYIDFVAEFNWKAGQFGDADSCFWGGREDARRIMEKNGCMALRFFKDEKHVATNGMARSWLFPVFDNSVLIFNGYGMELRQQAQILSAFLNQPNQQIDLRNMGDTGGTVYINNGHAYLFGEKDLIKRFHGLDLNMK